MRGCRRLTAVLLVVLCPCWAWALDVGEEAPVFSATDDTGTAWNSADHVGKKTLVVYFYPADMTGGCTAQACGYRDAAIELAASGVQVVGVSGDTVENHAHFKRAEGLNFMLLADPDGEVAKAFGVALGKGGSIQREIDGDQITLTRGVTAGRWTFVIGLDGRVLDKQTQVDAGADAGRVAKIVRAVGQCEQAGVDPVRLLPLLEKPLYEFSEPEVDAYLRWLHVAEPDLRRRVVHLGRKNLNQPYDIYLLGEMPFETYDPQPLYCLDRSDCLVFSEHTYAMALGTDWPRFMVLLQRIRYRDGRIGVATRNHYTEADWDVSNRWLVEDITAEVAGDAVQKYSQRVDRARFLQKSFGLKVDIPVEQHEEIFLPYDQIGRADPELREGDFVNVVRGNPGTGEDEGGIFGGNAWVGHTGLVMRGGDGTLHFLHSTNPKVREQPLHEYIDNSNKNRAEKLAAGKPVLLGFKFLRLRDDPLAELKKIDGPRAPRVTLPGGGGF